MEEHVCDIYLDVSICNFPFCLVPESPDPGVFDAFFPILTENLAPRGGAFDSF